MRLSITVVLAVLPLCLVGCQKPEPVIVKVPVAIDPPKVTLPDRPALPIVEEGDSLEIACQKMAAGLVLMVDYSLKLETLIKPYAKAPLDVRPERLPDQPRNQDRLTAANPEPPRQPGPQTGTHR